jgi:hypothetical protein
MVAGRYGVSPAWDRKVGRKRFFLKKEAKTFCELAYVLPQRLHHEGKSFLVLFFKKELLSASYPSSRPIIRAV